MNNVRSVYNDTNCSDVNRNGKKHGDMNRGGTSHGDTNHGETNHDKMPRSSHINT